mmetsp:Transcript_5303/g.8828  ORF Transcript_5303/g.8828 Transcript_5303/m.8828 type:complete len:101 (-) Transcript_5303:46-348(-)
MILFCNILCVCVSFVFDCKTNGACLTYVGTKSYFNLVFKSNVGSVKLWDSLGFQRVSTLENAARLEGLEDGELDTAYGYRYDLEKLPDDYLGIGPAPHRK